MRAKRNVPILCPAALAMAVLAGGMCCSSPVPAPLPAAPGAEKSQAAFQERAASEGPEAPAQKPKDEPPDPASRYRLARALHLKGVDGDDEAAERAREMLQELAPAQPENPLVLAYLGSATVLAAKRALLPWQKGKLTSEGLALLDRSVALAPDDLEVRFVRGVSSYPLPFFFDREEAAAADFAFVAGRAEGALASGKIDGPLAAGAFYYHGLCLEDDGREDEARVFWEKAASAAPASSFARAAAEKLKAAD